MKNKELLDWVIMEIGCRVKCLEEAKKNYKLKFIDPTPKLEKGIIALREIYKILLKEPKVEHVLDDVEKRYLKNVIRPFKDKIIYIRKRNDCETGWEYLHFKIANDDIYFPYFKKGTMYKNMQNGKEYTLEKLGIHYDK